jgi:hypothetical protein
MTKNNPAAGEYIYIQVHSYGKTHVYEWKVRVQRISKSGTIICKSPTNHTWTVGGDIGKYETWRPAPKSGPDFLQHEIGEMTYEEKVKELLA